MGAVIAGAQAITHAIETRQVGRDLTRHNQVVRGQRIIEVRAVYLNNLRPLLAQLLDGSVIILHHAFLPAIALELLNQAYLDAGEIPLSTLPCGGDHRCYRLIHGGRIEGIVAGDDLVQQRGIQDRAATGTSLIQGGCSSNKTIAGHGAVGWLNTHSIGQRGWLADGAAGIGTNAKRRLAGSECCRSTTAGAARGALDVIRVMSRTKGRVLIRRTHGKLIQVGLAQDWDSSLAQTLRHGGVIRRNVALQHLRGRGGRRIGGNEQILQRQGHACQTRSRLFAGIEGLIHGVGSREGFFRPHVQEGIKPLIGLCDAIQEGLSNLAGSNFAGVNLFRQLGGGQGSQALRRNGQVRHLFSSQNLWHDEALIFYGRRLIQSLFCSKGAHNNVLAHRGVHGVRVTHRLHALGIHVSYRGNGINNFINLRCKLG